MQLEVAVLVAVEGMEGLAVQHLLDRCTAAWKRKGLVTSLRGPNFLAAMAGVSSFSRRSKKAGFPVGGKCRATKNRGVASKKKTPPHLTPTPLSHPSEGGS